MRLFFLLLILISCKQNNKHLSELEKEHIIVYADYSKCSDNQVFYLFDESNNILDSLDSSLSDQEVRILSQNPKRMYISPSKGLEKFKTFYFDKGENKLAIDCKKDIDSVKIIGSKINEEYESLHNHNYGINKALLYNYELIRINNQLIQNSYFKKDSIQLIIDKLKSEQEIILEKYLLSELDFFEGKTSSYLFVDHLSLLISRSYAKKHIDRITSIYKNLTPDIKNTDKGKLLKERIDVFYKSNVGSNISNITLNDISKKPINFNNLKGKYLLIDFWASWCVPCIQDFPFLKNLKKAHKENLNVISISIDKDITSWEKAIKKHQIDGFIHISLAQNQALRVAERTFSVTGIPVKILVNPEGVIIGRWRGYDTGHHLEIKKLIQ
ncbi:TlpA disulfide reductase family protein [Mesonia sp. K7]|uniref:TlpA family protein disulfide reductase n=1 Tax=Mesonia sp. K7 TaxID=2218606 RepID=UPI000DA73222|nr:TlpA disulfide reductase family protein [Mesonia sp. K7]PZD78718.1 hypothetical protein DNG35_04510 [Mesonia sp. K7]